jgi:hypothetical protein
MSDIKKVRAFGKHRRTAKIKETLADKQRREDAFINRLDEIADEILSKRLSGQPLVVPTDAELNTLAIQNPETAEMLAMLFDVADKMKNAD